MIVGRKKYCDKCGCEIEHDLYHTLEWYDSYEHTHETSHKAVEVCNACYEKAFHYIFQAGMDVEERMNLAAKQCNPELNLDLWNAVKKEA